MIFLILSGYEDYLSTAMSTNTGRRNFLILYGFLISNENFPQNSSLVALLMGY